MSDLYELLGVPREAPADEIKRAYRRQAREHHPDAGGDEEHFKRVTHAYQVLSDDQKRARYDRFGDDGTPGTRGAGQDPFGFGNAAGFGGIGDVIDAFFGSGFGGGGGAARGPREQGGRDVLVGIELTLEQIATGVRREVPVEVAGTCATCGGTGSATGAPPAACEACGGRGQVQKVVRTAFGQLATAAPCAGCRGSGRRVGDPCTGCGGDGRTVQRSTYTVDIPAGVDAGGRLRVAGAGEAGRQGARPGDLYVEVQVADHELYERDGRDLVAEVTVPVTQAALGGTVRVPTVHGEDAEVEVPPGTQPGDVLRIRQAGLPVQGGGRRGEVKLLVRVEVPTGLDDEQRDLLTQLADLRGEPLAARDRGLFSRLRDVLRESR